MRTLSIIIAALCLLPIVLVLSSWMVVLPEDTQVNWLHVQQTVLGDYLSATFYLAAGILILTLPLGVGAAWYVTQYEFCGRKTMQWMLIMPLALPGYISAFAYGEMFDYSGPIQTTLRAVSGWEKGEYWFPSIRSIGGAVWVLGFAIIPYVYLLACAGFSSQSPAWREVAQSLGVNRTRFFWRIALPAARPFIATSAALILMESLADIGAVGVLGVPTLSSGIYRSWAFMHEPLIAGRMAGLLLMGIIFLLLIERLSRNRMAYIVRDSQVKYERVNLKGRAVFYAMICCWLPIIGGFLLPLTYLLYLLLSSFSTPITTALFYNMLDTLIACGLTGLLVCIFAFAMVVAERKRKGWLNHINLLTNLGYAVPGVVIAVGMLMLMGWLRDATSLLLIGGFTGLFIAFVIRFMAIGYNPLHVASTRISPEIEMVATSLGSSNSDMVRRIYLPLLKMPLCVAFLLVVLDVLKELPITLILRPFNFKTLAISSYDFASDDRAAEAAPFALALILFACITIFLLHLTQRQRNHRVQH